MIANMSINRTTVMKQHNLYHIIMMISVIMMVMFIHSSDCLASPNLALNNHIHDTIMDSELDDISTEETNSPNYNPELNTGSIDDSVITNEPKLAFVIFRHGDRSPYNFPKDDSFAAEADTIWPNGPGLLTNQGKRRAYQLGKYLAQRYSHLLADSSPRKVVARASNVDRCIATTLTVLAGAMKPQKQWVWADENTQPQLSAWQPVAVHDRGDMLNVDAPCPRSIQQSEAVMDYARYGAEFERQHSYLPVPPARIKQLLIASSGFRFKSLFDYYDADSNLSIENATATQSAQAEPHSTQLLNQLPSWYTEEAAESLAQLASSANLRYVHTIQLKRFNTGLLIDDIVQRISTWIQTNGNYTSSDAQIARVFFYGTHDTNVEAIMESLGAWRAKRDKTPGFVSSILIEVYRKSDRDDHEIKLFYNNRFPIDSSDWQTAARNDNLYEQRQMAVCLQSITVAPSSHLSKPIYSATRRCTLPALATGTRHIRLTRDQWQAECN
ncbi:Prostatic acid phosphatase, partial [Fragariocoptes setiger]